MAIKITMTEDSYQLKAGCKTVYEFIESENKIINETQLKWIIDAIPFFKRLGGSEHKKMCYTCAGYKVYELVSKSPDRQQKTIRKFNYEVV